MLVLLPVPSDGLAGFVLDEIVRDEIVRPCGLAAVHALWIVTVAVNINRRRLEADVILVLVFPAARRLAGCRKTSLVGEFLPQAWIFSDR
jgi:hypothetical protein